VANVVSPEEVSPTRVRSVNFNVTAGFSGELQLRHKGLVSSQVERGSISTGTAWDVNVTIPDNTLFARFRMYDSEVAPNGVSNANLYLYDKDGKVVSSSVGDASDESIHVIAPEPGVYTVWIDGRDVANDDSTVFLHSWIVTDTTAALPNVKLPASSMNVTAGAPATLKLSFSGLKFDAPADGSPASRYLGAVEYLKSDKLLGYTLLSVNE
jgi:hypothetical protein